MESSKQNNVTPRRRHTLGHLLALGTIALWSLSYVASKLLLDTGMTPFEILVLRFALAYAALWAIRPRLPRWGGWHAELPYILCGIFGVTVYFLFEHFALVYTSVGMTGVLTGTAPLFVALAMWLAYRARPTKLFALGFILAVAGMALVTFQGGAAQKDGFFGDLLALLAAVSWAVYSLFLHKIGTQPTTDTLMVTRRIFFWGLVAMVPCIPVFGFDLTGIPLFTPEVLVPLFSLALLASSVCYVTYNLASTYIGTVQTSVYIYFIPALTVLSAFLLLGESLQPPGIVGIALVTVGLIVSERGT